MTSISAVWWIRNSYLFRLQLRIFRVQDPDPAHIIDAYLEKKKLKFNQEEEFTSYLPFSISHYSPTLHSTEFTGLKLEIIFFIYLLFHYLLDPEQ